MIVLDRYLFRRGAIMLKLTPILERAECRVTARGAIRGKWPYGIPSTQKRVQRTGACLRNGLPGGAIHRRSEIDPTLWRGSHPTNVGTRHRSCQG